jgi:D-alanine-D-alanine ligase-like ATP-grasp enzyme
LKVLLVCHPRVEKVTDDQRRFADLALELAKGGVEATVASIFEYDQFLTVLDQEKPDIVFPAIYFVKQPGGEKINITKLLDEWRMPYIGSDARTLELVLVKSALKQLWQQNQVSTPEFCVIRKDVGLQEKIDRLLEAAQFPLIIKPDTEGNSRGLDESSIVCSEDRLITKAKALLKFYDQILVERYLGAAPDFREYTIALIGNGQRALFMPAQIKLKVMRKPRIVTTQDKDRHNTFAIPVCEPEIRDSLIAFGREAFAIAGVRDYARLDVMHVNGKFYAIEINGQPMIPDKWFEACAQGVGLNKTQYLNAILFAGIQRNIHAGYHHLKVPEMLNKLLPEEIKSILVSQ